MEEKKTTRQYKRTLKSTVGTGMSALAGGNGRRFYVLEHRDSSKYHRAGESQKIIIDQIELGCNPDCQVRFDQETWGVVSRRHAAIEREGNRWKLIHLSTTNSTFLNGRKIESEWYLENGDEIQLAVNGPRLGFIAPEGKQGLVSSIKMTERLELFRKQALKPYKRAIAAMAVILVLAIGGLGTWNYYLHQDVVEKGKQLAEQYETIKANKEKAAELEKEIQENNKLIEGYEARVKELRTQASAAMSAASRAQRAIGEITGRTADENLKKCYPYVYYVELSVNNIKYKDGTPIKFLGTAFLLEDGRLVTAHHVVDVWSNVEWKQLLLTDSIVIDLRSVKTQLNRIAHNEEPLDLTFDAYSPTGDHLQYHYTSEKCPFKTGTPQLKPISVPDDKKEGITWLLKVKSFNDRSDWAYIQTDRKGGLKINKDKSVSLGAKTRLDVLGYPHGRGAENRSKPTPIYTESTVARDGLDVNGTIMLSNEDTQGGNSGGPVFVKTENEYKVIGILSGSTMGKDRVVPINEIQ